MSPLDAEFDENSAAYKVRILALRVDNLGKEKEMIERELEREREERERHEADLEKRIEKIEKSFQRGAGIMMIIPLLGGVVGFLIAYGKTILKPWTGAQ